MLTEHLTSEDIKFLRRWDDLLLFEEQEGRRKMWNRTTLGKPTLSGEGLRVRWQESVELEQGPSGAFYRFQETFLEIPRGTKGEPHTRAIFFSVGDPISVVDEEEGIIRALGHIALLPEEKRRGEAIYTVLLDRPIQTPWKRDPYFNEENRQVFQKDTTRTQDEVFGKVFLLQQNPLAVGFSTVRWNLMRLLLSPACQRSRELIIRRQAPQFHPFKDPMKEEEEEEDKWAKMNEDQRKATMAINACKDYCLILGMPGTGKTTMVAYTVWKLAKQGKSILLTAYTHSAVDTILLKLQDIMKEEEERVGLDKYKAISIGRLGRRSSIHPRCADLFCPPMLPTVAEASEYYGSLQIVATTAFGIRQ